MSYFVGPSGRPRAVRIPAGIVNVDPYSYDRLQDRELVRRATVAALDQGSSYESPWKSNPEQHMKRKESVHKQRPSLEWSLNKPLPPTPTPRVNPQLHYLDGTPRTSLLSTSNANSYFNQLQEPRDSSMSGVSYNSGRLSLSHISTSTRSSLRRKAPVQDLRRQVSVSTYLSPPQSRTVSGVTASALSSNASSDLWAAQSQTVSGKTISTNASFEAPITPSRTFSGTTYSTSASLKLWIPSRNVSGQTLSTNASSDPWLALADVDSGYGTGAERKGRRRPPSMESTATSLPRPSMESTATSTRNMLAPERLANATPSQYLGHEQFRASYDSKVNQPNNPRFSEDNEELGEPLTSAFSWSDDGRDDVKQKVKDGVKWMKDIWRSQRR